jgi:methylamine dehydrogenase accessory protein MauD
MTSELISHVLLWAVVIVQGIAILALARQVGVLHERVAPAGALMSGSGPGVGEQSPRIEVHALAGNAITVGGALAPGKALLMLFVSATCPICKKLIPIAKDFARSERLEVLFVGDADAAEQRKLIAQFTLDEHRFVNGPEVGMTYRVDKLPYAVLLDDTGLISAKGLVNSREHFESLIVAKESGYSTIQSYLKSQEIPRGEVPVR